MNTQNSPDPERVVAEQVTVWLHEVPTGAPIPIESSSRGCLALELLVPAILRRNHPEWEKESIDGFVFSSAETTGEASVELSGTCILISDQTVTPFRLNLSVSASGALVKIRIRLGELGSGSLRISGPECTAPAARELLSGLAARLNGVDWVYDVAT